MSDPALKPLSVEEYLAIDEASETKHEYFAGQVYAMSGGSFAHALISNHLAVSIGTRLVGSGCQGIGSDLRVHIEESGFYTYPDFLIYCGKPEFAADDGRSLINPLLLVEVLSPSTEHHDRTFKLDQYRKIPSLKQYLLIAQEEPRVEVYEPTPHGWQLVIYSELAAEVKLAAGVSISLKEIYEGVPLGE